MNKLVYLLLEWYHQEKRILPWRQTKDPYHVWVSEIMLQQTRIEAVLGYYERFMNHIPDIFVLAHIPEDELLKLWEGLGYYNRARNLKKAAQIIVENYNGIFPSTYDEILKLPGIGEYTASAIASICFNEPTVTVDGNVLRVYTRIQEDKRNISLNNTKKEIRNELSQMIPLESGDFNEGLMELGETICLPNGIPKCNLCPLQTFCLANKHHSWSKYPVKDEKKAKKELDYTIFLFTYEGMWAIRKRKDPGLLHNLWEFPNVPGKLSLNVVKAYLENNNIEGNITKSITNKHIFTHQVWNMTSYIIKLKEPLKEYLWKKPKEIEEQYALPTAFKPFFEEIKLKNVEINIK